MAIIRGGISAATAATVVEKPTGTIDGVNDTFNTTQPYVLGTLLVFKNGLAQSPGGSDDFVEVDSTTFQFNVGAIPGSEGAYTDKLLVSYQLA